MYKNIRKIKENEIDIILNIWYQSNINTHTFIDKSYYDRIKSKAKDKFTKSKIYVYCEDQIIKGFTLIKDSYIDELYIDIKYQNQGIGTKIINFLKEKHHSLKLNVFKKNKNAINFYLKNGFTVIEENIEENTKEKGYLMKWENKPTRKYKREQYNKKLTNHH